jgi:hypothetical protein
MIEPILDEKEEQPKLYNKATIVGFSILLSTFFGGVLYSQNLVSTGNRRQIVSVLVFCLLWNIIAFNIANRFTDNFLLTFILPNLVGGLILANPIWEHHFKDIDTFKARAIWIPFMIVIGLVGILIALNYLI